MIGMSEKRIYRDRKEYLNAATKKRRKEIKKKAIEYKGGKCQLCGYDKYEGALDFHHLDPNEKDFAISAKGITRAWEKVKEELDKCVLLCANCHRETHAGRTKYSSVVQLVEQRAVNSSLGGSNPPA